MFWVGIVFVTLLAIGIIALIIFSCTCGKGYFWAKDSRERLQKIVEEKTPEDVKQYVTTQEFTAKNRRIFVSVDSDGKGLVDWEKEKMIDVVCKEWGDDMCWHNLTKELNDLGITSVHVSLEEWYSMCKWFEYIKHDIANNGLPEGDKPPTGNAPKKDASKKEEP